MFGSTKNILRDMKIEGLERRCESYQRQIWDLRQDMEAIAKHLGVQFKDINKRVLVKTDAPQSEP